MACIRPVFRIEQVRLARSRCHRQGNPIHARNALADDIAMQRQQCLAFSQKRLLTLNQKQFHGIQSASLCMCYSKWHLIILKILGVFLGLPQPIVEPFLIDFLNRDVRKIVADY
jgi:hypothetical protein